MGGAKRTRGQKALPRREPAGHRPDGRRLHSFLERERGKQPGKAAGEHGLSGPRRSDEESVVPARGGHLERPLRGLLPAHVGQIERRHGRRLLRRGCGRATSRPAERLRRLGQRAGAVDADPLHQRTLGSVLLGHDQALEPALARLQRDGQYAAHRQHLAGERELADHQRRALRQRSQPRGSEDPERDGEVEADPLLAQVSWSEIDRDLLLRQLVPGIAQRGEDARARVVARVVGQADQVEPGQSQRQVHLHLDEARAGAGDGRAVER